MVHQTISSTISFEVLPAIERPQKRRKHSFRRSRSRRLRPLILRFWNVLWLTIWVIQMNNVDTLTSLKNLDGKTWVYYSTVFPPYAETLNRLKTNSPELVSAFTTAYEVWIAYHAILQAQCDKQTPADVDENQVDLFLIHNDRWLQPCR